MKHKHIKEIHTFGTSFTAGGGHSFDIPDEILKKDEALRIRVESLNKVYSEKPKTMFNYSWPGQLQRLVKKGIKVFNHAKEGFGNERMYRITNDILWDGNNFVDCDDKIFLYEFSSLGRKEIWSNTVKDYCILNYGEMTKRKNGKRWVNIQQQYRVNTPDNHLEKYDRAWKTLSNFSRLYLEECVDEKAQIKKLQVNNHMFLDSLLYNEVNFYSVGVEPEYPLDKIKDKFVDFQGYSDFVDWGLKHRELILGPLIGVKDNHFNLKGNKMIANIIFNKLKEEGFYV